MQDSVPSLVREAEENYTQGTTKSGKYVNWNMYEVVEKIFAYLNSTHITGSQDSLGRKKPFFNIVTAAVNIWYRATDLDRKDIVVLPDKSQNIVPAFVATVLLQDWMKRERFGVFLNQWGRTLSQYGSAVVKFVKKGDRLVPSVVPWNRLIVDPVNFEAIPVIEKFYKTPAQLQQIKGYDKKVIKSLIDARSSRENLDGTKKDQQNNFIELFEVHGELSAFTYKTAKGLPTKDSDKDVFYQQMHVISYLKNEKGEYDDYTLYCGLEESNPYMITHLIEEDGRTLSIGAVEYLFDAQWMQNHTIKAMKDQLDLASKLIFQTADKRYADKNVLTSVETGDILNHDPNSPLTEVNNVGHDISSLKLFADQWRVVSSEITSTPDAVKGNTLPSGTPYSLAAYTGAQALSLFEIMTENKGHMLEDMLRVHIIPFLKTKMNNGKEIQAVLEDRDVQKIDSMYIPRQAIRNFNKRVLDQTFEAIENPNAPMPSPFMQQDEEQIVKQQLAPLGNQRFFTPDEVGKMTWGEALKDLEWKLDVGITNESQDKQVIFTTLATVLQTIATNPAVLQDPNARLVFNKILAQTGSVSPVELSAIGATPTQIPNQNPLEDLTK